MDDRASQIGPRLDRSRTRGTPAPGENSCSYTDDGDPWCASSTIGRHRIILLIARIELHYVVAWPGSARSAKSASMVDRNGVGCHSTAAVDSQAREGCELRQEHLRASAGRRERTSAGNSSWEGLEGTAVSINKRDNMRLVRLATLMAGVVVSAFASSFAGQRALAELVEPVTQEAENFSSEICYAETFSSSGDSSCPMREREMDETARARAYLIATASPGYTMTRQGPERAIGLLHPAFVNRLAAAIAEARGAGLPLAGIFSAYRPPAFGIGSFADKFHSLHTYGLAVDVTGIGPPGTPSALLWHEIAARYGVICPYGPHNLLEWNHCQPTWVKIILPDNPLRDTVTADGPISLEGMFEVGYSLIAVSGTVGASSVDPPAHFFTRQKARTAMSLDPGMKTANNRTIPKTALSVLNSDAKRWPPLSAGKVGWAKGVPRIAKLEDEARRPGSRGANRTLSHPSLISLPPVLPEYSVGRSVIPSAHNDVGRLRQPRSTPKVPISAGLAKTCRALAIKAHPTQRPGSGTGSAQAQREYFQECVAVAPKKV